MIISNGAILYLVNGAGATTNPVSNTGTIVLISAAGQNSQINYGQSLAFANDALGPVVKTGAGTGSFVGNFGAQNRPFVNNGTILVNGGTALTFDTDGTGATNTARVVVNAATGTIRGNDLVNLTMCNLGVVEARDGTLLFVSTTGNLGTWVSTNYGGGSSVLNFTTGNFDLGGGTLLNSNGTIRVINGANMSLSTSYRQNWGTIDFAGAANVFIANAGSADSLTNEFVIKKSASGQATLTTGFGASQNNYGFINKGTLSVSGGGTLTINPNNAFSS